ncbi:membrane fusion protein (multidrug efflux system) [Natronospira proteinivora]|uniref:Membrane fusion protein (Multidrug efflux system) n=1 Tax=Natronospira proteinivora TaxID=1807133 RepID=A0ABT1G9I3_9GAMM|nr:efflux RND transporter periplasmic adaptor subunit [Natronospira proteinivora]MCP1727707.1 membrane fusion protein (multidrug efflux system) [Natronospira proteinivora]
MNWAKFPQAVLLMLALGALAACQEDHAGEQNDEDSETLTTVRVEEPRREQVSANHRATATLQAISDARVLARAEGLVRELRVEEGDMVEEGDILAVLDDRRRRLEVEQHRANLSGLEQDLTRHKRMLEESLVSADAVEQLRYEVEAQRAGLALAEVELTETRIKAPVDGVVSERHIRRGDNVSPGDTVFRVTNTQQLEAEVHVPERLLGRLAVDQLVEIRTDAAPDQIHTGQIARISPIVNADSGTVKTTVRVQDSDGLLRPGAFARVRILYETRDNALMVPRQALTFENGRTSLFVVEDGVAKRRTVTTGQSSDGWVEITEGLSEQLPVITLGHATLRDGAKVRINGQERSEQLADNQHG